jgi:hypothetical protein
MSIPGIGKLGSAAFMMDVTISITTKETPSIMKNLFFTFSSLPLIWVFRFISFQVAFLL